MKFNKGLTRQPRKQRKALYNAPMHVRQKLASVHLSKELRKKFKMRALVAKKGDKVRIISGEFRKMEGKITEVDLSKVRLFIEGVERKRQGGKEFLVPIQPSNCILLEWNEPRHKVKKSRKAKAAKPAVAEAPKKVEAAKPAVAVAPTI